LPKIKDANSIGQTFGASPIVCHLYSASIFFWQIKKKKTPKVWHPPWQIKKLGKSHPLHAQIYALGEDSASASRRTRNLSISFSPVREARQSPPARAKKPVDLLLLTPPLPRARPRAADSARSLPPRAVTVAPPSRPRRFRFPRLRRRPWTPQM